MAEESERPGTCRSNVGCDAIDEPCTNKMVPAGPDGSPAYFSHRKRRTSSPLLVQCSSPFTETFGETAMFISLLLTHPHVSARRKTLHWFASTSIAARSPTWKYCRGWVCTRSV